MARDSNGNFLDGGCFRSEKQPIPILLESFGLVEGLKLALAMGWNQVILESDCP